VHLATYFGDVEAYIAAGFKIFRNYDGNKSVFPEVSVKAVSTNNGNGTVYAAVSAAAPDTVHLIAINRLSHTAECQLANRASGGAEFCAGVGCGQQQQSGRVPCAQFRLRCQRNQFSYYLAGIGRTCTLWQSHNQAIHCCVH
jgi:hypothetical protein